MSDLGDVFEPAEPYPAHIGPPEDELIPLSVRNIERLDLSGRAQRRLARKRLTPC